MIFLDHHFIFLLYFFYWLYTLKMAPNQQKPDFLQNRWFLAIFRVLKIASKDFVHTLESHKDFVHTKSLRYLCIQSQKCVVHTFYFLRISSPNPFVTFKCFWSKCFYAVQFSISKEVILLERKCWIYVLCTFLTCAKM